MKHIINFDTFKELNENKFSSSNWEHRGKYDYAISVVQTLLDNKPVKLGKSGEEGEITINDFNKKELESILIDLKENPSITLLDKFNSSFYGGNNIWTKIFKCDFVKRKTGGGILFEDELCKSLQNYVLNETGLNINKIADEKASKLYDEIKDSDVIKFIKDKLKDSDEPETEINKYIKVTGKGSTARNTLGQIFNSKTLDVNLSKKLEIDDDKDEKKIIDVLSQSGKIIADITITKQGDEFNKSDIFNLDEDDIYISCKDGISQFSGLSMQYPFYGEGTKTSLDSYIINSFKEDKSFDEFKKENNENKESFFNLCNFFNVDPKVVYDYFKQPIDKREKNVNVQQIKKSENDSEVISTLIQLLIGGNYWYVNSDPKSDPVFIDPNPDDNKFNFIPSGDIQLNPRQIVLKGKLEVIDGGKESADIKFRDSQGTKDGYPFRMFIVPSDKYIIHNIFK